MIEKYLNQQIVVDTDSHFAYVGELVALDDTFLQLKEVAIYDRQDARIPLDKFLVECADFGPAPARRQTLVRTDRIVAVTRLADIIVP